MVDPITIKEVDFSDTSEAKRRTRLLSNHEVTVTADVNGAGSDVVTNALDGVSELGGATVEEIKVDQSGIKVDGESEDDGGVLVSHLSMAVLLLSMVAALAA